MDEKNENTMSEMSSKAEAFDRIVNMNNEVMRLAKIMNEKHAAHQESVKNYKEQDKEMQKMIAAYAVDLPLFDGKDEAGGTDANQAESQKDDTAKTGAKKKKAKRGGLDH